jgi:hypothetical protein
MKDVQRALLDHYCTALHEYSVADQVSSARGDRLANEVREGIGHSGWLYARHAHERGNAAPPLDETTLLRLG